MNTYLSDNRFKSLLGSIFFPLFIVTLFLLLFFLYQPSLAAPGAVLVVNSVADTDDGNCNAANCTLREAILAANNSQAADRITFSLPPNSTITLAGTQLPPIDGRLIIDGSTAVNLTLSGNDASRVLVVGPDPPPYPGLYDGGSPAEIGGGTAVTLTNLTITRGSQPFDRGGGIYNSETLVIQNSAFNDIKSKQGGIFNEGSLTIADTTFINNKIVDYSGGGAGLYNDETGVVTITNSIFSMNTANFSFSPGAAIFNNGGDVSITESVFNENSSFSSSAIYHKRPGTLNIVDSTFTNQLGGTAVGALGRTNIVGSIFSGNTAGALYVYSYSADIDIEDTVFSENATYGNGGAIDGEGGSIFVKNSLFSGNSAESWGGAILASGSLNIVKSTFINNSSSDYGGAIMKVSGGGLTVEETTFNGNTADRGGAIGIFYGSATVRNSTLSGNSAQTLGGGIYSGGYLYLYNSTINGNGAVDGGGIYSNGSLNMSNSILANSSSGGDCVNNGTMTTNINNLVEDGSCNPTISGDPLLSPLQNNGGPTLTHTPLPGSLAIDSGDNDTCLAKDQRGVPRPIDGDDDGIFDCDIGAVEKGRFSEVNSANDLNDGVCSVSHCSLREAIILANTNTGLDIILFNIPGPGPHTIQPLSPLPDITSPVLIDGFTQPGAVPNTTPGQPGNNAVMQIELDGANAGPLTAGLTLSSYNSLVKGLVIHGFGGDGIRIVGSGATGNWLAGNFIGTNVNGDGGPGNGGANIFIGSGASNNRIGGEAPEDGNIIAFGGGNGVVISSNNAVGNEVRSNAIFSNDLLGVDLGDDGPTANDPGDGDSGPNNLQNYPSLVTATADLGNTIIEGMLNSTGLTTFTLEFFANSGCDPSGYGEGEKLLGTALVPTDNSGDGNFDISLPIEVASTELVAATATDPAGSSSEYSPCIAVIDAPISALTATNNSPTPINFSTWFETSIASGGNVSYVWDFGDGTGGVGASIFHRYPAEGLYTAVVTASNSINMLTATTIVSITEEVSTSVSLTDFGLARPDSGRVVWPAAIAVIGFLGWLVIFGRRRRERQD